MLHYSTASRLLSYLGSEWLMSLRSWTHSCLQSPLTPVCFDWVCGDERNLLKRTVVEDYFHLTAGLVAPPCLVLMAEKTFPLFSPLLRRLPSHHLLSLTCWDAQRSRLVAHKPPCTHSLFPVFVPRVVITHCGPPPPFPVVPPLYSKSSSASAPFFILFLFLIFLPSSASPFLARSALQC